MQSEKKELAALALELQRRAAQLETREQLNEDVRAAERLQFEQQAGKLATELADERAAIVKLRGRVEELQSAASQAQLALQVRSDLSRLTRGGPLLTRVALLYTRQDQRVRLEMREQQRISENQRFARVVERHERRAGRLRAENESLRAEVDELRRGMAEIEAFEKTISRRGR